MFFGVTLEMAQQGQYDHIHQAHHDYAPLADIWNRKNTLRVANHNAREETRVQRENQFGIDRQQVLAALHADGASLVTVQLRDQQITLEHGAKLLKDLTGRAKEDAEAERTEGERVACEYAEDAAVIAAVQIQQALVNPAWGSINKVIFLEQKSHELEIACIALEEETGHHRAAGSYHNPPNPHQPAGVGGLAMDSVRNGRRLRLVLGPSQGARYMNMLGQQGGFQVNMVPTPARSLAAPPGENRYTLPAPPISSEEARYVISKASDSMGDNSSQVLLAVHRALGEPAHQAGYISGFIDTAKGAASAVGKNLIGQLRLHFQERFAIFGVRPRGGPAGPEEPPLYVDGNCAGGATSTCQTTVLFGPAPGYAPDYHDVSAPDGGFSRIMVVGLDTLFAVACTRAPYVPNGVARKMAFGFCLSGASMCDIAPLVLCSETVGGDAEGTGHRLWAFTESDCMACLLTCTVTGSTPRGWLRMLATVRRGLWVEQSYCLQFSTAGWPVRLKVLGETFELTMCAAASALVEAVLVFNLPGWRRVLTAVRLASSARLVFIQAVSVANSLHEEVLGMGNNSAPGPQISDKLTEYYRACHMLWRSMRAIHALQVVVDRIAQQVQQQQ